MNKTPKEELDRRIKALQLRLAEAKIDGALIVQNADLFYFTGTVPQGWLFVPFDGHPILFIRKNPNRIHSGTLLEHLFNARSPRELAGVLADKGYKKIKRLGMELDVLPFNQYARYVEALQPGEIVDISPVIQAIRSIKSPFEIAIIRQAAKLGDQMMRVAREALKEGMTELELSARIEMAARMRGHQGYVRMRGFNAECYWGPVISGAAAAEPAFVDTTEGGHGASLALPAGAGHRPIARHEPVIVDMAATIGGYNADITAPSRWAGSRRSWRAHTGSPWRSSRRWRATSIRVSPSASSTSRRRSWPTRRTCCRTSWASATTRPASAATASAWNWTSPLSSHATARPSSTPGHVIALEPKFTFPGEGVVGVEDVLLVTENGGEKLTKRIRR